MSISKIRIRNTKDKALQIVIYSLAVVSALPLVLILYYVIRKGIAAINWSFFVNLPKPVGEVGGGIANALIGSLLIVLVAALMAIPPGVMAGIYIASHRRSKLARFTRLAVDVLNGTPSIVMGIVAYILVVETTGHFSGFSGSVALGLMMLPLIVRTTEETLLLVPKTLKEAAYALGAPSNRMILKVWLPASVSGILNGIMLSLARVGGETAPLLFTAFGSPYLNWNIFQPMQSVPLLIFNYSKSPFQDWEQIAWGASLVLIVFILIVNVLSKIIAAKWRIRF